MLEVLIVLVILFVGVIVFHVLAAVFKVGIFVVALPLKILFGILTGVVALFVVPLVIIPLLKKQSP